MLAASLLAVGVGRTAWVFALGLAVAGAASGVACGAAQAMLVGAGDVDRAMVRWTLFATVGDIAAPLVTGGAVALGFSYRGAMLVVAGIVALQCVSVPRVAPGKADDEEPSLPLRAALSRAVRSPRLWMWLFTAATCTLLDELVVALAALRLVREEHTSTALAAVLVVTFSVGALLGTAITDRLVGRFGWRVVLMGSALLCLLALGASARSPALALFFVGATSAPHHPLAFARAYETMPRNPGTVQAISQLFVVIDIAAPLVLGTIADRWGLRAAMLTLVAQPLVILVAAGLDYRRLRRTTR